MKEKTRKKDKESQEKVMEEYGKWRPRESGEGAQSKWQDSIK